MLKVGLTGGIASGKSVVGEMLIDLGAQLIKADEIAHQLMRPGQPVYKEVVRHFGPGILAPDGAIERARLAQVAFGIPAAGVPPRIQELNQIVHPAVVKRQGEWMEEVGRQDPCGVAVVEAALLLEAGAAAHFNRLIVVTCRPEQRVERWALARGVDRDTAAREVHRRAAAQLLDEVKIKAADYVIDNSGTLTATNHRVREIYAELASESGKKRGLSQ